MGFFLPFLSSFSLERAASKSAVKLVARWMSQRGFVGVAVEGGGMARADMVRRRRERAIMRLRGDIIVVSDGG